MLERVAAGAARSTLYLLVCQRCSDPGGETLPPQAVQVRTVVLRGDYRCAIILYAYLGQQYGSIDSNTLVVGSDIAWQPPTRYGCALHSDYLYRCITHPSRLVRDAGGRFWITTR